MVCEVLVKNREPVLGLKTLKTYLKVDYGVEDEVIQELSSAAQGLIETHIGQNLMLQTYGERFAFASVFTDDRPLRFGMSGHPLRSIRVSKAPVRSVLTVTVDGVPLAPEAFFFENERGVGKILFRYVKPFKTVLVEYEAGLVLNAALMPEGIRQALLRLVAYLYENRGEGGDADFPVRGTIAQLLSPYRLIQL